ncbi:MAG TPA: hypothetical protein PK295_01645 [Candidatus Magasanikbacteria bacterium]|nr:hypothetical protein [Candidatus Magasanikbacteria bacterium]
MSNIRYALLIVSLIFFGTYFYLHGNEAFADVRNRTSHNIISNQPDEMANYFFIKELVIDHSFGWYEPLNEIVSSQVHARSMTVINGRLEPIGFPFFIVLASIVAFLPTIIFGAGFFNIAAISLVPILAVAANFLLFGMIRRIWNERMAFISSLLLFLLPSWWYWASRPFQHTVPFIFCILLGLYGMVRIRDGEDAREKVSYTIISALGISSALAIRPTELVWVMGIYGCATYLIRAHVSKRQIIAWGGTVVFVALLFFVIQDAFYGSPFASGYVKPTADGSAGAVFGGGQGVSFIRAFFFPFGIHIKVALATAYRYFFLLFNSWTLWAFVSFLFILARGEKKARKYVAIYCVVSLYLVLWYGSWSFIDNLLGVPSVGSSQARYFMPIYIGMIPLIAYFCDRILLTFSLKKQIFASTILGVVFFFSSHSAVFSSFPEGLARVRNTMGEYADMQDRLYDVVPAYGLVVTRYGDKYIFPGRKVMIRTEETIWAYSVKQLLEIGMPVWWYDLKLSTEEQEAVDELLNTHGLVLSEVKATWDNLQLKEIGLKK